MDGRGGRPRRRVRRRRRAHDLARPAGPRGAGRDGEVGRRAAPVERRAVRLSPRPRPRRRSPPNPFADEVAGRRSRSSRRIEVAYIQHAPMEPRAAVAEWDGGKLTVWTGTQVPFGVKDELARAFGLADDKVRVIVPDFGGGFGGKHSGECAVEAARLAKAAGKPVRLVWTRAEEFTWAQFRPAAVIDAEASLDADGAPDLVALRQHQLRRQPRSRRRTGSRKSQCRFVACDPPLRHGSYRGLAATANTFARECVHGRAGRGRRPRPAGVPPRPPGQPPAPRRARRGGPPVRLGRPVEGEGPGRRRRPGLRDRQGLVRRRLRRGRRRPRHGDDRRPAASARRTSAARSSTPRTCSTRSRGRSSWASAPRSARRWSSRGARCSTPPSAATGSPGSPTSPSWRST